MVNLHWAIMVKIILIAVKIPNSVIYHRGWNHLLTSLSSVEKLWYRAGLWKTGRQSEAGTWFLGSINGDRWVLWYKTKKMWTFFPRFTYSNTILQCMQLLSDRVLKPSDDSSVYFIHTSLRNVSLHWVWLFFLHRILTQQKNVENDSELGFYTTNKRNLNF